MSEKHPPEKAKGDTNKTEDFEEMQARKLSQAGLLFIYTGMGTWAVAVVVASVILVIREIYPDKAVECFSNFGPPGLLVVASAMFSGFGYWVLRTVSTNHPGSTEEPKTGRGHKRGAS